MVGCRALNCAKMGTPKQTAEKRKRLRMGRLLLNRGKAAIVLFYR
jgi:hypothetical protein